MIWSMDRKGIGEHLPDPRLAVRIFSSMPDDVQQLIKLNVVGGFQTMSMKAKWDTDVSDKCPFCGECDTREHRLLHCPVGLKVRENHASAVDTLRDQRQEWVYIPLPRQHDMCILLRAYLKLIKPPVIPVPFEVPEDTLRFFHRWRLNSSCLCFCTNRLMGGDTRYCWIRFTTKRCCGFHQ